MGTPCCSAGDEVGATDGRCLVQGVGERGCGGGLEQGRLCRATLPRLPRDADGRQRLLDWFCRLNPPFWSDHELRERRARRDPQPSRQRRELQIRRVRAHPALAAQHARGDAGHVVLHPLHRSLVGAGILGRPNGHLHLARSWDDDRVRQRYVRERVVRQLQH